MDSATTTSASSSAESPGWTKSAANRDRSGVQYVWILGVDGKVAVSGSHEQRIAAIAGRQRGRVSRRQLHEAGVTRAAIRNSVTRGRLLPLPGGVLALAPLTPIELADEAAALLTAGPGSALSHHSAALLWDMELPRHGDGRIHVLARRTRRLEGIAIHRARNLAPHDVGIHRGLPVTSPARTLLDQAERLTHRRLELALDRALVAGIVQVSEIRELAKRSPGRPGAPILKALAEHQRGSALTASAAEELFLSLVRASGLPAPLVNQRVHDFEVDFYWPAQRLIVEIDGFRYHSTRRAFEHDHRKDAALRALGFTVLRFTYHQLESTPLLVIAQLAREL
jgi:very-short-patch-repair endonuclease